MRGFGMARGTPFEKGHTKAKGGKREGAGRKPLAHKLLARDFYSSRAPKAIRNIDRILDDPKHPEHGSTSKWILEGFGGKHVQQVEVSGVGPTLGDPLDRENARAAAALGKETKA